jgi:hypothetical protein
MEELPGHELQAFPAPPSRQLEIRARWRRAKSWLAYSIILLSVVQIILAGVHTGQDGSWGLSYWAIIGPVVSQIHVAPALVDAVQHVC